MNLVHRLLLALPIGLTLVGLLSASVGPARGADQARHDADASMPAAGLQSDGASRTPLPPPGDPEVPSTPRAARVVLAVVPQAPPPATALPSGFDAPIYRVRRSGQAHRSAP